MRFPLDLWGITSISSMFALVALVLIVTSEVLIPFFDKPNMLIDKKKLRASGLTFTILFLSTIAVRIVNVILESY